VQHRHLELGRHGEDLAADFYRSRGYVVVARNWRAGRAGELDLIAARGGQLVVCEVKTRSSDRFGTPVEAVDWRKQRRIRSLALRYLAESGSRASSIRFDVAAVRGDVVEVVEGAF
jgi:putative endonuclease